MNKLMILIKALCENLIIFISRLYASV